MRRKRSKRVLLRQNPRENRHANRSTPRQPRLANLNRDDDDDDDPDLVTVGRGQAASTRGPNNRTPDANTSGGNCGGEGGT